MEFEKGRPLTDEERKAYVEQNAEKAAILTDIVAISLGDIGETYGMALLLDVRLHQPLGVIEAFIALPPTSIENLIIGLQSALKVYKEKVQSSAN